MDKFNRVVAAIEMVALRIAALILLLLGLGKILRG
jgi:hypothetical protein